jgi:hypothetical protein
LCKAHADRDVGREELEAIMTGPSVETEWAPRALSMIRVATALIFMEPGRFESDFARVTREVVLCGRGTRCREAVSLDQLQYPYAG